MKLVALKCEFCGGLLTQISTTSIRCEFCKVGYLIDTGEADSEPEPDPTPTISDEEARLRADMLAEEVAFTNHMSAAGVRKRNGRWSVNTNDMPAVFGACFLLMLFFCLCGLANGSALSVAVGCAVFVLGLLSATVRMALTDTERASIERFYRRRAEWEAEIAAVREAAGGTHQVLS